MAREERGTPSGKPSSSVKIHFNGKVFKKDYSNKSIGDFYSEVLKTIVEKYKYTGNFFTLNGPDKTFISNLEELKSPLIDKLVVEQVEPKEAKLLLIVERYTKREQTYPSKEIKTLNSLSFPSILLALEVPDKSPEAKAIEDQLKQIRSLEEISKSRLPVFLTIPFFEKFEHAEEHKSEFERPQKAMAQSVYSEEDESQESALVNQNDAMVALDESIKELNMFLASQKEKGADQPKNRKHQITKAIFHQKKDNQAGIRLECQVASPSGEKTKFFPRLFVFSFRFKDGKSFETFLEKPREPKADGTKNEWSPEKYLPIQSETHPSTLPEEFYVAMEGFLMDMRDQEIKKSFKVLLKNKTGSLKKKRNSKGEEVVEIDLEGIEDSFLMNHFLSLDSE